MNDDPDAKLLGRLMRAWKSSLGVGASGVRDLVERASTAPRGELSSVLYEIAEDRGEINRARLGWWIKRHEGQFVDDTRIIPEKSGGNANSWRIASGLAGSSAFSSQATKVSSPPLRIVGGQR